MSNARKDDPARELEAPAEFEPRSEAEKQAPDWMKQILHRMRTADPNNLPETP